MSNNRGTGENYVPPGQREELLKELEQCDSDAEAARQTDNQQRLLEELERGLYLRRRLFAEGSQEVIAACRRLCEMCNRVATFLLQEGNLKGASDLLKRAEQVSEKNDVDRATTWNNLACYYRRTGKLRTAVAYLERALAVEEHMGSNDAAQTHLNLCATLSQLQRHADALYHAQSALIRIYETLTPLMLAGKLNAPGALEGGSEAFEQVTVLCIAYHNLAVEHEYLKNLESAICTYAEGLRWANAFLGAGHELIKILKNSMEAVRAKLPPNSSALRRVAEVVEGWGPITHMRTAEAPNGKDRSLDLLTPRDGKGDDGGDASGAPENFAEPSYSTSPENDGSSGRY